MKQRADIFLFRHGYAASRSEAQAAIRTGNVVADGIVITRPAQMLNDRMSIAYQSAHPYVSRGGIKLAAALAKFQLSPTDRIALDLGASTGGFTEVLLAGGAKRVYAVDVGHGQLHPRIARDHRVISIEGLNARDLTEVKVPEAPQVIVADLSFISLKLALSPALNLAAPDAWGVFLVKPQFEVGRDWIGKAGIVHDASAREAALESTVHWIAAIGWKVLGTMESPITGGDGNIEYLLAAQKA